MAVIAGDAIAAAYLADAATAGPTAAAATKAAAAHAAPADGILQQPSPPLQQQQASRGSRGQLGMLAAAVAAVPSTPDAAPAAGTASEGRASPGDGERTAPLEAGLWPTFVHSQLGSTRQLQRFANQVALNRWMQVHAVGLATALAAPI